MICALIPFLERTVAAMLIMTCLLGLCCGVAFGTSYQLVAHFSATCNVALTIGETLIHSATFAWATGLGAQ